MKIKRMFLLLFAILAFTVVLSSCDKDNGGETPSVSSDTVSVESEPAEIKKLVLIDNGKTDFKITRSENAEGYYRDTASAVYKKLKSEYSSDFKHGEDWLNPLEPDPATSHEILLFSTVRPESEAAMADLTSPGYIIRVTDCKIVIVGTGITQCNAALSEFFGKIIPENTESGIIAFPIGLEVRKDVADSTIDFDQAIADGKSIGAHITEVFSYPTKDNFNSSQGAATDGKYVYIAVKRKDGDYETDRIIKIDAKTWEVVKESDELDLDHANDMTYDTARGELAVVNMKDGYISFVDTETLKITKSVYHSFYTSAIEYIEENGQYLLRAGNGFIYTDKDLIQLSYHEVNGYPEDHDRYTGQGMYADTNYLYIPRSPTAAQSNNIIIVCDSIGNYLTTVTLATKMESETIFVLDGEFYINFNRNSSAICKAEFYTLFE